MTTRRSVIMLGLAAAALVACDAARDQAALDDGARPPSLVGIEPAHYAIVRVDDGVLYAARLGATTTTCGDRAVRHACALGALDLSRLDLSADDEQLARARIADGTAIVRAKLAPTVTAEAGTLVATSIWLRRSASSTLATARTATDQVFVLRDVHEGCDGTSTSCAWLRAEPLAGGRAAHYVDLDVSLLAGGLDEATKSSIAKGETLAHGVNIGSRFVVATLYVPFGTPASAPVVPRDPAERAPVN